MEAEAEAGRRRSIKDTDIKKYAKRFVPELSFLVLAYARIRQACSRPSGDPSGEVLLPRPAPAVEYRRHMFAERMEPNVDELVRTFSRERMVVRDNAFEPPSSYGDFRRELEVFATATSIAVDAHQLNTAIRNTNIDDKTAYIKEYRRGRLHRKGGTHRVCASVERAGARNKVTQVWRLRPSGPSVAQQLRANTL